MLTSCHSDSHAISPWQRRLHTGLLCNLVLVYLTFPASNALANTLMASAVLLWTLTGQWAQKIATIKRNPGAGLALALYGVMWVGLLYTPADWREVQPHLVKYFKLVFLVLVVSTLTHPTWQRRCWHAFVAAMLFTLVSTYLSIWVELPWTWYSVGKLATDHTVFKDHISQNMMMTLLVLYALRQCFTAPSARHQALWIAVAALATVSITHLSTGRTGYLALVTGLALFAFSAAPLRFKWLAMAGTIALAGTLYLSSTQMQERVELALTEAQSPPSSEELTSIGQRLYFAQKTWDLIQIHPWLGWGTGAYHGQYCRVATSETWCHAGKVHPHNQFLFIWVEHGLLGLLLMLGLMWAPIPATVGQPRWHRALAAGFFGIFAIGSLTHGSLWLSTESHFFTLITALFLSARPQSSPSE